MRCRISLRNCRISLQPEVEQRIGSDREGPETVEDRTRSHRSPPPRRRKDQDLSCSSVFDGKMVGHFFLRERSGSGSSVESTPGWDRCGDQDLRRSFRWNGHRQSEVFEEVRQKNEKLGKREGQTGGMRKVGLAGVEREPERLECGTGSFLMGPGCDLVSPDGVNYDVDRAFLVESRGKERGGRELLGQGKGKPFFSPSFLRTVMMKRWGRKT